MRIFTDINLLKGRGDYQLERLLQVRFSEKIGCPPRQHLDWKNLEKFYRAKNVKAAKSRSDALEIHSRKYMMKSVLWVAGRGNEFLRTNTLISK